jgi:hypothetical protein
MAAALATISLRVAKPKSGLPMRVMAVPAPVIYTTGKPSRSISFAVKQSKAPGATTMSG